MYKYAGTGTQYRYKSIQQYTIWNCSRSTKFECSNLSKLECSNLSNLEFSKYTQIKFELHEIQVDDEYQPVPDSTTTWYQKYYQYQYRLLQVPELAFEYYDLWRISTRGIISENTSTRVLGTWVRITY